MTVEARMPPYWLFRLCDRIAGLFGCWIICVADTRDTEENGWIKREIVRRRWCVKRRPV
jgi:hypothetical protein